VRLYTKESYLLSIDNDIKLKKTSAI